jgi:hypothetical protein
VKPAALRCRLAALAVLLCLCLPRPVEAATWWWNTTTAGLWTTVSNWSDNPTSGGTAPGTAPGANDDAVFDQSSVNGIVVVRLSADQSIGGLTFANTGTTSITGTAATRTLTIGTGGITVNAGAGPVTLGVNTGTSVNIALGGSQSWTNNSDLPPLNEATSGATIPGGRN